VIAIEERLREAEQLVRVLVEVRREAASRGMLVRKSRNDPNLHRYIMVDREPHWPTSRASGKGN